MRGGFIRACLVQPDRHFIRGASIVSGHHCHDEAWLGLFSRLFTLHHAAWQSRDSLDAEPAAVHLADIAPAELATG